METAEHQKSQYVNMNRFTNILETVKFSFIQQTSELINKCQFSQCIQFLDSILSNQSSQINNNIVTQTHFSCVGNVEKNRQFSKYQFVDLLSIKSYALTMHSDKCLQEALKIAQKCLEIVPSHLVSHKRKATILEKMGKIKQCKQQYHYCLLLEPESRSLKHKLKRLNMKSHNSSSCQGWSSDSKESIRDGKQILSTSTNLQNQQIQANNSSSKTTNVQFGSFEVIQVSHDDSDEHVAKIKQQITKIANKKPNKSILKQPMSASVFKQKPVKIFKSQTSNSKIEETDEKIQKNYYKNQLTAQKASKSKSKSVSFNDPNNLDDFN